MRVMLVAANASERMGGEAVLPLRYFVGLRRGGKDVFLLTHARCRQELQHSLPAEVNRIFFVEDHPIEILIDKLGSLIPHHIREVLTLPLLHAVTECRLGKAARRLARELTIDVLHQPTPVSPRAPSFLYDQPCPVVIGPMNGAMDYPPALRRDYGRRARPITQLSRLLSGGLNRLFPGKAEAALLIVANKRTAASLSQIFPFATIEFLAENAVDLEEWPAPCARVSEVPDILFVGRLVHWKAVDILIEAFAELRVPAELVIAGEGPELERLQLQALGMRDKAIRFVGRLEPFEVRREMARASIFVLPSIRECGGAVVLEAMASCLPVVAINWGGPADYVSEKTGRLLDPATRPELVGEIARHLGDLIQRPEVAKRMGHAGRQRVEMHYCWTRKIEKIWAIYHSALNSETCPY